MANLQNTATLAFGPVPSRRLGRSLGINNIPPKTCTYSCVYCQVGKTTRATVDRQDFYKPEELSKAVICKLDEAAMKKEKVNFKHVQFESAIYTISNNTKTLFLQFFFCYKIISKNNSMC